MWKQTKATDGKFPGRHIKMAIGHLNTDRAPNHLRKVPGIMSLNHRHQASRRGSAPSETHGTETEPVSDRNEPLPLPQTIRGELPAPANHTHMVRHEIPEPLRSHPVSPSDTPVGHLWLRKLDALRAQSYFDLLDLANERADARHYQYLYERQAAGHEAGAFLLPIGDFEDNSAQSNMLPNFPDSPVESLDEFLAHAPPRSLSSEYHSALQPRPQATHRAMSISHEVSTDESHHHLIPCEVRNTFSAVSHFSPTLKSLDAHVQDHMEATPEQPDTPGTFDEPFTIHEAREVVFHHVTVVLTHQAEELAPANNSSHVFDADHLDSAQREQRQSLRYVDDILLPYSTSSEFISLFDWPAPDLTLPFFSLVFPHEHVFSTIPDDDSDCSEDYSLKRDNSKDDGSEDNSSEDNTSDDELGETILACRPWNWKRSGFHMPDRYSNAVLNYIAAAGDEGYYSG